MSNTLPASQGPLAEAQKKLGAFLSPDAHRILQGLFELKTALGGALLPPDIISPESGFAQTSVSRLTASGNTPAGAIYVSVQNVGLANGTVNGATLEPGKGIPFPTAYGILLPAIPCNGTGTVLLISAVLPPA